MPARGRRAQPDHRAALRVSPERAASIDAELAEGQLDLDGPDCVRARRRSSPSATVARRAAAAPGGLAAAAAVVLVVAAIAIPVTLARTAPTASFALEAVADVPLEATVRLSIVGWGTRIELDCRYTSRATPMSLPRGGRTRSPWSDADGTSTERLDVAGASRRDRAPERGHGARASTEIAAIEIRSVDSGRLLDAVRARRTETGRRAGSS